MEYKDLTRRAMVILGPARTQELLESQPNKFEDLKLPKTSPTPVLKRNPLLLLRKKSAEN